MLIHLSGLEKAVSFRGLTVIRLNRDFPFVAGCRLQFHLHRNTEVQAVRLGILSTVIDTFFILKDLYPCPFLPFCVPCFPDIPGQTQRDDLKAQRLDKIIYAHICYLHDILLLLSMDTILKKYPGEDHVFFSQKSDIF